MCWKVQCQQCQLFTWAGCGEHVNQVMSAIPMEQRCRCQSSIPNSKQMQTSECTTSTTKQCRHDGDAKEAQSTIIGTDTHTKLTLLCTLSEHEDRVWCCAWSPRKDILASCSGDKLIKLWTYDAALHFKCIQTLDAHTRTVRCVSWNPSGQLFASASFDGTIGIWQRSVEGVEITFECVEILEGHDNEIKSLSWDSSGKLLSSCSRDKSVWIWEMDDSDASNVEFEVVAVKRSHDADVKCVVWHPTEEMLLSCSYDDAIKTYKSDAIEDDWYVNQVLKTHTDTVWCVAFSPLTGNQFVSCSADRSIAIFDKMKVHQPCEQTTTTTTDASHTHKEDKDQDQGQLLMMDDLAYKLKQRITDVHQCAIYHVDWLCNKDDGVSVIVSCSGDNSFKILQQSDKNHEEQFSLLCTQAQAHLNDVNWAEFGPRVKPGCYLMATASDDESIKIWQFETRINPQRYKHEIVDLDMAYDAIVNDID